MSAGPLPGLDPGDFGRANQPVSPPARAQQPTARGCNSWRPFDARPRALPGAGLPAIEPRARRRGVDAVPQLASQRRTVSSGVEQDVRNRSADLERRLQHAHVVSVRQDRAAAPEDAMYRTRQARTDRLHASRQSSGVVRLHEQVCVIALERVVNQSEVAPVAALRERPLELADELCGPERRDTRSHLQGDMAREKRDPTSGVRLRCRMRGRGPGLRPAPRRRPPQRGGSRSASSS